MSLSDEQYEFYKDTLRLGAFLIERGIKVTYGEAERTEAQHRLNVTLGRSKAKRSRHQDRLALDLNFYFGNGWVGSKSQKEIKALLLPVGEFWEALNKKNRWGGHWTDPFDPAHFERRI